MVSLRLTREGVCIPQLEELYKVKIVEQFDAQIRRLTRQGLLELAENGEVLRLTHKGRLFGNRVFLEFIDNPMPNGFDTLN